MSHTIRRATLLALAAGLFASAGAIAQDNKKEEPKRDKVGPYVQFSAGGIFAEDRGFKRSGVRGEIDYDPGYDLSLSGGYRFASGLRTELEFQYGNVEFDKVRLKNGGGSAKLRGDLDLYSLTMNAFYDINTNSRFTPYIGGGLGVVVAEQNNLRGAGVRAGNETDADFTALGEIGLAIDLGGNFELVPAYRFQWIDSTGKGLEDDKAHILRIGARYTF